MGDLEVYDLDDNLLGVETFSEAYSKNKKEYEDTGKVTRQVKIMRSLLLRTDGKILLHKRGPHVQNPNLWDKTVGGHVEPGHSFEETMIKEGEEELRVKVIISPENSFEEDLKNNDLKKVAVCKKVDSLSNFMSKRVMKGGDFFYQPTITEVFIGYYDGEYEFVDGECTGIEELSIEEVKKKIQEEPETFTEDLVFMIKEYKDYLN